MMTRSMIVAAAMAGSLLAAPALADTNNGYGVATAARAGNVYSGNSATSAYRTGQDSSLNYTRPSDTVPVQFVNCSYSDPSVNCAGTAGGTYDTNYNLTASNSSVTFRDDLGYQPATFSTGAAAARADLATGSLGAEAHSSNFRQVLSGPTYVGGASFAQFNDLLTFTIAGATAATRTNISVSFTLDGAFNVFDPRAAASVQSDTYFGSGFAQYVFNDYGASSFNYQRYGDRGWVSSQWTVNSPGNATFTGVYTLNGASDTVGVWHDLLASAQAGADSSFFHTSRFSLTLPENVTYSSASGTFLSGGLTAGVPEPATWAMLILGFGMIGSGMRRRNRAGARPAIA